jgi:hypothetical protein
MKKPKTFILKITLLLLALNFLPACVLTKLVSVPMRVVGAAVSIIPVAGNPMHDGIDVAAETVDDLPF